MPQCYGTFTPDNLIIYQTVCDECNQYFGDNIELHLGRDTIEGVQRYKYGIKPDKEPKHKRMEFRVAEGDLRGVIVTPKYSGVPDEIDFKDVIQVGFFKIDQQKYVFFRPKDIPTAKELINQGYEIKEKNIEFRAGNEKEMQFLLKVLKEKGMEVKLVDEDISGPEPVKKMNKTLVEGTVRIDSVIYRGIAKIAFNYLAYIMGKDFVLSEDFNGVRNFIRNGLGNSRDYFGVNEPPILFYDRIFRKYNIRVTSGHLVVVEWQRTNLISKVSIFNMNTYLVKLCRNFKGIWRPIRSGHHFDVESKEVSRLITANPKLFMM
jgi:hypothetical protein